MNLIFHPLRLGAALLLLVTTATAQTVYQHQLNLNFGSGTNVGLAAFGATTNDFWSTIPAATTVSSTYTLYGTSTQVPVVTHDTFTNLFWATGTNAPVTISITNLLSVGHNYDSHVMFESFLQADAWLVVDDHDEDLMDYISIPADPKIAIRYLPTGTYNLYVYGNGGSYYDGEGFRVKVGTNSFTSWISTSPSDPPDSNWAENNQYVLFTNLVVGAGEDVLIELSEGYDYDVVNGLQIVDLSSTNAPTPQLPSVVFDPSDGATVPVNVALSVPGHGDATIYYTADGSTPTTSSSVYSTAISLSAATTLKALATKSGYLDSAVSSASYPLPTAPAPTVSPASGDYHHALSMTVSSGLSGASYEYSYDGTNWNAYSGPVTVDGLANVWARTTKAGYQDSPSTVRLYTFSLTNTVIEPFSGIFTNATSVLLTNATAGTTLQYSLDDGQTWSNYSTPVELDGLGTGTGSLKVSVTKTGYTGVTNAGGLFTFITAAPEFSHASGNYTNTITVTLTSDTTGATIEYSWDRFDWTTYGSGLVLSNSATLFARATKTGYLTGGDWRHDAATGFSAWQGWNQWYYLYSTETGGSPDSYLPFYDNTLSIWRQVEDPVCLIGALQQHPGTTNDSVRTFLAPADGSVTLTGWVALDSPTASTNGVQFRVLLNTNVLSDWISLNDTNAAVFVNLTTNVATGDNLHFQLSSLGEASGDLVSWSPAVTYTHSRIYTINDRDGDGLSDALEDVLGTDPDDPDSDADGVSDYHEYLQGRNPLIAGAVVDTNNVAQLLTFTPLK